MITGIHRICIVAAVSAIFLTSNTEAAKKEIGNLRIGVVFPLTGPLASLGQDGIAGAELALEGITAEDPVFGKHLVLIKSDSSSTASTSEKATSELIEKMKADVIIGGVTSFHALASAKVAQRLQRPYIATNPAGSDLTDIGNFIFRSCFADPKQGGALAAFSRQKLSATRAAILHDKNSPAAVEIALEFERRFVAAGGKIAVSRLFDHAPLDFDNFATELKKADVQVVLAVVPSPTALTLRDSLKKNASSIAMLGTDLWEQSDIGKNAGESPKIFFASHFAVDDPDAVTSEFVKKFSTKFGRPPTMNAALAYDSVQMIAESYRRVETTRPQILTKNLAESKQSKSAMGVVSLDSWRNAVKPVIIKEIKGDREIFNSRIDPEI